MGRVSDIHIEYQDKIANGELDEMPDEILLYDVCEDERDIVYISSNADTIIEVKAERDFYKSRFEWERARVYKAWKDNPEVRSKLAYTRRWKK